MDLPLRLQHARAETRRQFLKDAHAGLGALALAQLLGKGARAEALPGSVTAPTPATLPISLKPARAKHVIYLHMSGAPPQQDLFDYKPELVKHHLQPCPDELLKNQRFAFIKGHPKLLGTPHKFEQC